MRKEVIFAILIGALFGVAVVLGIRRLNTSSQVQSPATNGRQSNNAPQDIQDQDQQADSLFLAISSPENKTVLTESPSQIKGLTLPNTWVVMITDDSEQVRLSNGNGEFSFETELSGGLNLHKFYAIDTNGDKVNVSLNLVYTTQLEQ